MPIPPALIRAGYKTVTQARQKVRLPNGRYLRGIMIGTEGLTNSGKTEFILSCPGPGALTCIDRGIDGCLDNLRPPAARRSDWLVDIVPVPMQQAATQTDFQAYYAKVRDGLYTAAAIPEVVSVGLDCHSDFWELHRLAAFGKLAQVMPLRYGDVYAQHRAIWAKLHDYGKIIIGTNKLKDAYEDILDPNTGLPLVEADGTKKRRKTGDYERQGFWDTDYLWSIQIRHLIEDGKVIQAGPRKGERTPTRWGLRVLKCKVNPDLKGAELWDDKCNFKGLVNLCYPDVPDQDWGL